MQLAGYEVEALIGRGGMAEVFLARVVAGPRAGRPVALKRLLPCLSRDAEHVALFAAEARLAAQLRHPGIVEVLASGEEGGIPFIAMEYVDGKDLARVLAACAARGIRIPVPFALHLAREVAVALDEAHRARDGEGRRLGVVHCDVSPSNVFVSRAGEVKLGDFGVARAAGARARAAFGKVRYLAPEQLSGEPVGPRTDVFALGAVLHELLTGAPAFPGDDAADVARRIVAGPRRAPSTDRPEASPAVDAIVLHALDPKDRFDSAGALAEALAAEYDPLVGDALAVAALVRGLFGA
ncbi:MAG: serine/threonine-protein kinase [Anaeromyxobacteraceae bacterium]